MTKVYRSTNSGRFVSEKTANRNPSSTIAESVGAPTNNDQISYRSAVTGKFVNESTSKRYPRTTTKHKI